MTLLLPLGLLGLIGIGILILIWIIKPNYQKLHVSSTYIWMLSLKLQKKKLPISKLRNLLLILCQILFLAVCALVLARPAVITKAIITEREVIAIVDCSASMRAGMYEETRFDRAVDQVRALAGEVFDGDGLVTVILAGDAPSVIAQRATAARRATVENALAAMQTATDCSYGTADIDAAMMLCEEIISNNANAQIYLYTDTDFSYVPDAVTVVDVTEEGEWNAGILSAYTVLEDNYYTLYVQVACYGRTDRLTLSVDVYSANAASSSDAGRSIRLQEEITCSNDQTVTVAFRPAGASGEQPGQGLENFEIFYLSSEDSFYSYGSIYLSLAVDDCFRDDDEFFIYDGQKEVVRVQYASPLPNNFFIGALEALSSYYRSTKNVWDIRISEVHDDSYALSGFDLYIFEHSMPPSMPTDGIVILWDPDMAPSGSGLTLGNVQDYRGEQIFLTRESENPLLNHVTAGSISVTRYTRLISFDPAYEVLLSCDTSPVLLAMNQGNSKVLVAPFSVHYSNITIRRDFVTLLYNLMENWMPATIVGNSFAVHESVSLNARGETLTVTDNITNEEIVFNEFPAVLSLDLPGTYTLTQVTFFGKTVQESIYVTIPSAESNVWSRADAFRNPYLTDSEDDFYDDLIFYFAAALVALLFAEWLLQARDNL